jgi:sortase A
MSRARKLNPKAWRNASIIIVAVGVLIIASIFLPVIQYEFRHKNELPYSGKLSQYFPSSKKRTAPIPEDNRLVIPEIGLNQHILEGSNISVMNNNGLWRLPLTSDDPSKSNMVIIGHRYMYTTPYGAFYYLNKLKEGDMFALYWNGKEHDYTVNSVRVVLPTEVSVEAPSKKPQLTLYTCTPLWSATDRLVVTASEI